MEAKDTFYGDLVVEKGLQFYGMVSGDSIVKPGAILLLRGRCRGNLTVEQGGEAHVFGTVSGSAINRGGRLIIHGTVAGNLIQHSGETLVEQDAMIIGKKY